MRTGWVSVSLSPLFEKLPPPPVGRLVGRLTVPTGGHCGHCMHVTDNNHDKRQEQIRDTTIPTRGTQEQQARNTTTSKQVQPTAYDKTVTSDKSG